MRILVTGSAGFIGCNLVRYLIRQTKHQVIGLDKLTYAGNLDSLNDLEDHPRFIFVKGDIGNQMVLAKVFGERQPEAVIHLAAESHVDRSIDDPFDVVLTNVLGTYILLDAALVYWQDLPEDRQAAFRFLHVSTDEVFGSLGPADPAFCETTPYDPHSPYAASKAAADHLVRAWWHTYGLPVLVTNCSNNYGPYQFPEKLIPLAILKAIQGEPIPVYGRGENIRDWLYVEDHVEALELVLTRGRAGETYLIGGRNERRNIDLVNELCSILDELHPRADGRHYEEQISFVPDRPGHDLRYAIEASRVGTELGWSAKTDLSSGLRRTVEWYLENRAWWQRILDGSYRLERLGLGAI